MVLLASEYDQSRFLKADDLDGGERKFKIKNVTAEDLGGDGKLIVWFTNDKKGLILNKTNNRVLRTAFRHRRLEGSDHHLVFDDGLHAGAHGARVAGAYSAAQTAQHQTG